MLNEKQGQCYPRGILCCVHQWNWAICTNSIAAHLFFVRERWWAEGKLMPSEASVWHSPYSRKIWVLLTSKIWSGRTERFLQDIWKRGIMVRTGTWPKPWFFLVQIESFLWRVGISEDLAGLLIVCWPSLYSIPLSLGNIIHSGFFILTCGAPSSLFPHPTTHAPIFFCSGPGKSSLVDRVPERGMHK